jgi:hypothetical protein
VLFAMGFNKYSEYKLWRPTDGICYLDVSDPINLHTAHVSDREDKARNATSTIWSLPAVLLSGILSTLSFYRYVSQLVIPKVFLLPLKTSDEDGNDLEIRRGRTHIGSHLKYI